MRRRRQREFVEIRVRCFPSSLCFCNTLPRYPSQRSVKDHDGHMKGVMGTVTELQVWGLLSSSGLDFVHNAPEQSKTFTTQPIASFDWSPDKGLVSHHQHILVLLTPSQRGPLRHGLLRPERARVRCDKAQQAVNMCKTSCSGICSRMARTRSRRPNANSKHIAHEAASASQEAGT